MSTWIQYIVTGITMGSIYSLIGGGCCTTGPGRCSPWLGTVESLP